jgi:hypothetical protein
VFYGDIRRDVIDRHLAQVLPDEDQTGVLSEG